MKYKYEFQFLLIVLFIGNSSLYGQYPTGINLNNPEALESYTLIHDDHSALFLLDNCGKVVKRWNVDRPRLHVKLLENGNIVYMDYHNRIIVKDFDDNLVKSFTINMEGISLIYEVIVMPNGNFLCLARKQYTVEEFESYGFTVQQGASYQVMDAVLEFDGDTGSLVWEWYIADHVIQQRDENAPNYGILSENPQLLNLDAILTYDWQHGESFMINGFDYNPASDEIVLSIRKLSEVAIIDHSTTSEEASSHSGGRHGKGGDIIYRWGNSPNYGGIEERYLYFQHNPNWIHFGEHAGKIIVFNNGLDRPEVINPEDRYSSVDIIDPPKDENGYYILDNNGVYGPEAPSWTYTNQDHEPYFYSGYTSGAKVLPNGNVYITEGYRGRLFELTLEKQKVWEYGIPDVYYTYRTEKYPLSYNAFVDKELIPDGTIEFPESSYECNLFSSNENTFKDKIDVRFNMNSRMLSIECEDEGKRDIRVYNIYGHEVFTSTTSVKKTIVDLNQLNKGYYIYNISDEEKNSHHTGKLIIL